jgi:hypothetical protein
VTSSYLNVDATDAESLGRGKVEDAIADFVVRENLGTMTLIGYLSVIAQGATMLGLFGTVAGMVLGLGLAELARGYVFSGLTDLATADFTDTEIWQRSKVHTVDPATIDTAAIRLKEGDLVDLSTATQERVYRYLGDGATVYLGQTDLTDTGLWKVELLRRELVKAEAEAEAEATSGNPTANPTSTHVNLKTGQLVLTSTPNGGKVAYQYRGLTDLGAADFRDAALWTATTLMVAADVETEGRLTSGMLVVDRRQTRRGMPNVDLLTGCDVAAVKDCIIRGMKAAGAATE